jgi:site-specific recombinase XerD
VFVEATGSATCPVRLFECYMEWRGLAEGLLFTTRTGSMMTPAAITSVCRRIISAVGGEERVSSHSLRIGGATAAIEGGLTKEQVMTVGGWKSEAVNLYLHAREVAGVGASRRMGF